MIHLGIAELYCGASGKKGYYNSQEIGLARAMKKLGYASYIFYPDKGLKEIEEETVEDQITIIHCPSRAIGVHAWYDWNVLKNYRIQVVQIGSDNQLYAPSLIKYCDKNKIPVYSYIGTVETSSDNWAKRILMGFLFNRNLAAYKNHKSYAKTERVMKALQTYGVNHVDVAPVGLDTSIIPVISGDKKAIRAACELPTDKTILLYVGRIDSYKRPDDMITILGSLSEDYYGVIIGDGALAEWIELRIKEMKLENRIQWIRKLPNKEVQEYYYAADYFLNFNDQEIFGMSILEAMYQDCTVIARHAPGPDMIIENGCSGFLTDSLGEMKELIIRNQRIPAGMAKKRIETGFLWDSTANIFDSWIKEQTCRNPRKPLNPTDNMA